MLADLVDGGARSQAYSLDLVHQSGDLLERGPCSAPVLGCLAVGANDGPEASGHQIRGLLEWDAVTPPDRGVRRLDERPSKAVVEVRGVLDRERDVALEPLELLRTAVARRPGPQRGRELRLRSPGRETRSPQ